MKISKKAAALGSDLARYGWIDESFERLEAIIALSTAGLIEETPGRARAYRLTAAGYARFPSAKFSPANPPVVPPAPGLR